MYKNLERICDAFMDDNKKHRFRQRLLLIVVPFLLGFCGIVVLEIFLVQNGKMPWFVVRKAEQQYLFRTSGALVSYFYVPKGKKSITREEVAAIAELIQKHFPELSGTFNAIPKLGLSSSGNMVENFGILEFSLFCATGKDRAQGILVVARLAAMNTNDGISYETASRQWLGFVKRQVSNVLGGESANEK